MDARYVPQNLARLHVSIDFKGLQAEVDKEVYILQNDIREPATPSKPQQQTEFAYTALANFHFWHLQNIALPADWSAYKYLVTELYTTTPQRFNFMLNTNADTLLKKDIRPVPGKWVKVVIPLAYFKQQIVAKYAANGVPILNNVKGIGFSMDRPVGYPIIQTRSFTLMNEVPDGAMVVE